MFSATQTAYALLHFDRPITLRFLGNCLVGPRASDVRRLGVNHSSLARRGVFPVEHDQANAAELIRRAAQNGHEPVEMMANMQGIYC